MRAEMDAKARTPAAMTFSSRCNPKRTREEDFLSGKSTLNYANKWPIVTEELPYILARRRHERRLSRRLERRRTLVLLE
jgi:hypothetical protein